MGGLHAYAPSEFLRRTCQAVLVVSLTITTAARSAWADDDGTPDMITDRPDQTESAQVVPVGSVQVEVGWTRTRNDDGGVETTEDASTQVLTRISLAAAVELRLGFAGFLDQTERTTLGTSRDAGAGDVSLGTKLVLWDRDGWIPQAACLAELGLPTGSVSGERVEPSVRLCLAQTAGEFAIGANVGVDWETDEGASGDHSTVGSLLYTFALARGLTPQLGAFVELYGDVGLSRPGGPRHAADGGVTYLLSPNLQLDLSAGFGISSAADDWFLGCGFSLRWPQ